MNVDLVCGYRHVVNGDLDFVGKAVSQSPLDQGPHGGFLMLTKKALLVVFCSLVFPICPLLYGQATASFSGTVTDKTGSVVSGAAVKATAQATGLTRDTKSDDSGH